jgi:hypothetical protein
MSGIRKKEGQSLFSQTEREKEGLSLFFGRAKKRGTVPIFGAAE